MDENGWKWFCLKIFPAVQGKPGEALEILESKETRSLGGPGHWSEWRPCHCRRRARPKWGWNSLRLHVFAQIFLEISIIYSTSIICFHHTSNLDKMCDSVFFFSQICHKWGNNFTMLGGPKIQNKGGSWERHLGRGTLELGDPKSLVGSLYVAVVGINVEILDLLHWQMHLDKAHHAAPAVLKFSQWQVDPIYTHIIDEDWRLFLSY